MLICHLYVFFGKVLVQVFLSIFNRVFLFLLSSLKSPLCISEYLVFFFTKSVNLKPRTSEDNHAHAFKHHVPLRFTEYNPIRPHTELVEMCFWTQVCLIPYLPLLTLKQMTHVFLCQDRP